MYISIARAALSFPSAFAASTSLKSGLIPETPRTPDCLLSIVIASSADIFDTFITKTKYSSTANTNLGTTSISYNSLYNEKKYYELEVSSSKIKFNFTSPDNQVTADITWEASYSGQDVNCFWKLLLNTSVVHTTEDLVLCGTGDTLCGVMRLNRETTNYEVPSDKKEELRKNKIYNMYVSCTNVVPAPLYFHLFWKLLQLIQLKIQVVGLSNYAFHVFLCF